MTRIKNKQKIEIKENPVLEDYFPASDSENGGKTINIKIGSLDGIKGSEGDSAYEVAVANGFVGTEVEWLSSLQGVDGGDALVVAGAKTYQTLADLNAVSPVPDDGTPAKVANDPTSDNNGFYSVVSGVWVKDEDIDTILTFIFTGQSNMDNGDPYQTIIDEDRATDSRVKIWNDVIGQWVTADLTAYPWNYTNLDGDYNNRLPFHTAKRIAEKENKTVQIIFEATGGQSITQWMGTGVSSPYFVNIVDKITNSGVDKIDGIFWMQGENDGSDSDYHTKLKTLISQFRALPELNKQTPFIAGELATGLDGNGDLVLTSITNGEKLNRSFYRPFVDYMDDLYFNVAQGSDLPTVTEGAAAGIHFDGSAVLDYSYIMASAYYNTPREDIKRVRIPKEIANVYSETGPLNPTEGKIFYADATAGNITLQLPKAILGKEIWIKRYDDTANVVNVNIVTGETLEGVLSATTSITNGITKVFKATSDTNYDIIGRITDNSYLPLTGKASDSSLLNGKSDTAFLTAAIDDFFTATFLRFADSSKLQFGYSQDLSIWTDNSDMFFDMKNMDVFWRDGTTNRFTFGRTSGNFTITGKLNAVNCNFSTLPTYADDTAAASLSAGDMYKTATGELRIKL